MRAKDFIPASKPRNFVAKNQKTGGAGAHKDKKKAAKQGDVKHKGKDIAEASPETTIAGLRGLKSWQVIIMNNYYRGKYSDYSGRQFYVLATSSEEAKEVVLDNADDILKDLLAMKGHNGKKILPRGSAVRITPDRIGKIEDGTVAGRLSTAGFKKMYSPQGVMSVKLSGGAIVDVEGQEKPADEGIEQYRGRSRDAYQRDYDSSVSGMGRRERDWDEGDKEPPNNFAIYINGKKWKVFKGNGYHADDYRERNHLQQLKAMCAKKSASTGKKWEVYTTGEAPTA